MILPVPPATLLLELFPQRTAPPDSVVLRPLQNPPAPAVSVHPDKAISQRAVLLASITPGVSSVVNLADCDDVRSNIVAAHTLKIGLEATGPGRLRITGRRPSAIDARDLVLDAGNSATTARLLLAILAGSGAGVTVIGNEQLSSRPMGTVISLLRELGADLVEVAEAGRLPVLVRGTRLRGGDLLVDVDSAQPVSAALFAAIYATGPVTVHRRTAARDHTERLLRWTGLTVFDEPQVVTIAPSTPQPFSLTVPGDASNAALLAALHLASPWSTRPLRITGVGVNPTRLGFFEIAAAMGAEIRQEHSRSDTGPEPVADLVIRAAQPLHGTVVEGSGLVQSAIDELPLVAALATRARGRTVIRDAAELRGKDTDRIATTAALLHTFGAQATATDDGLVVDPVSRLAPPPSPVDIPADHRIVFAAFVLGLLSEQPVQLRGVRAAATSHPEVLEQLEQWTAVTAA